MSIERLFLRSSRTDGGWSARLFQVQKAFALMRLAKRLNFDLNQNYLSQ